MPRSAMHNLSHSVKYSDYMGYVTPIALIDVVPSDVINHKVHALIRTQPLLAPVMHEVDIDIHAFFVPDRLVWDGYEDFQSGGEDGQDTTVAPTMVAPASTGYAIGSLADYLGLPTGVPDYTHSALPFRGYQLIWNHFYRDSQLQTEAVISTADGADTTTSKTLQRPCWKRDYFTKARPEPQLGSDVVIPLTGDAPVTGIGVDTKNFPVTSQTVYETDNAAGRVYTRAVNVSTGSGAATFMEGSGAAGTPLIYADLSAVTGIPVTELREANATQRWMENNNVWGGRLMEQIMFRFGVRPQDSRMQWPEFLGAGETKIQFSEVLQTSEAGTDPLGEMGGHGISIIGSNRYKYRALEHGFIHVFMVVRPKTQYFQGIARKWSRETKFDYLLPEFTAIGDQAILNKELYAPHATPNGVFGYTPIYEEYRGEFSRISGDFRNTLKFWHMAREFSSDPALNSTFVTANPTNRIFPALNAAQLYVNCKHTIKARRPLPKFPEYRLY